MNRSNAATAAQRVDISQEYRHEAGEHRRILFERGSGLSPLWKDFRVFLNDLGPAPSQDHLVTRLMVGDLTYAPGKVAWMHRTLQQRGPVNPLARIAAKSGESHSQWVTVQGRQVEYSDLAQALGIPFQVVAAALRNNVSPEQLIQQASIAQTLCQAPSPWMSDERREAFMAGYRVWHTMVLPPYAADASPGFLFLFGGLPHMLTLKKQLNEIDLWDPPTQKGKEERQNHDLWRRYCENMARMESARAEIGPLKQYSLSSQVEPMWDHVKKLERRFRTGER